MRTITKKELINRIVDRTGVTKVVAKEIIQTFLDSIIDELAAGNRIEFREFGVFETKERAARRAQNPRTLERVTVPSKRLVKFKVGRLMRSRVSGDADIAFDERAVDVKVSIHADEPTDKLRQAVHNLMMSFGATRVDRRSSESKSTQAWFESDASAEGGV